MDLFDYMSKQENTKSAPLATRMRPTSLEEVVGQKHIIGEGKLLYRAIKADKLSSIIFYGPPGTGKSTLLRDIFAELITKQALAITKLSDKRMRGDDSTVYYGTVSVTVLKGI